MSDLIIRKPSLKDAPGIQSLIQYYAAKELMLPRNLGQICERLREFVICEQDGQIVGCGALHLWSDLAEIRSLAVAESAWRKGIGSKIVRACLSEAKELGVERVFVLTYQPDFFERLGFVRVGKERFPHKIWTECANCPHFPTCDEVALLLELDKTS